MTFTPWKKSYDQPDCILKSRDITLSTKVRLVKAMVFPVVMCGCVRWTIKKAEHRRTDAFKLWCWRTLLRVPWTARRSNSQSLRKSVLNIHWKDWHWSWTPILWPPDVKKWLIGKDPDAGKDWRWEGKGTAEYDGWRAAPTRWTWVWANCGIWWWTWTPGVLQSMGLQRVRHDRAAELNWT